MKIRKHNDGTYSLTGLTAENIRDFESGLCANIVPFVKGAEANYVPSTYNGWDLDTYRSISRSIADRIQAMIDQLHPVAYPTWLEDKNRYETPAEAYRRQGSSVLS